MLRHLVALAESELQCPGQAVSKMLSLSTAYTFTCQATFCSPLAISDVCVIHAHITLGQPSHQLLLHGKLSSRQGCCPASRRSCCCGTTSSDKAGSAAAVCAYMWLYLLLLLLWVLAELPFKQLLLCIPHVGVVALQLLLSGGCGC
jgi:hypothetical protein